jgi:hypothetical protein
MKHKTIDLETFLEGLPETAAANAKAAAARIDELERAAQRIGKSDRQYVMAFAGAGVLALIAAFMTLGGYNLFEGGYAALDDLVVPVLAGVFPLMILIYSLRMRERTRIDQEKFEIIETYFLPYNGIYFSPPPGQDAGTVSIAMADKRRKPDLLGAKRAGMHW